jgi:hypothetical protein
LAALRLLPLLQQAHLFYIGGIGKNAMTCHQPLNFRMEGHPKWMEIGQGAIITIL